MKEGIEKRLVGFGSLRYIATQGLRIKGLVLVVLSRQGFPVCKLLINRNGAVKRICVIWRILMARWTESYLDVEHISRISLQVPITAIIKVQLKTGESIEGVLRRSNVGNNGGQRGWRYYGELEIETKDHQHHVLDYLDIQVVSSTSSPERLKEYEDLGLITIVGG